jgi:transcriptional regulator with XRE-family HTH domain
MTLKQMGRRIRALRTAKHWSQATLATRAGLTRVYITRLEAGQYDPTFSTLMALAKALGVRVTKLLE